MREGSSHDESTAAIGRSSTESSPGVHNHAGTMIRRELDRLRQENKKLRRANRELMRSRDRWREEAQNWKWGALHNGR